MPPESVDKYLQIFCVLQPIRAILSLEVIPMTVVTQSPAEVILVAAYNLATKFSKTQFDYYVARRILRHAVKYVRSEVRTNVH